MEWRVGIRVLTTSLIAGVVTYMDLGTGAAWAGACGDTAGAGGTRIPCACSDTVETSTKLKATDPVVVNACTGDALLIAEDGITLDCRNKSLNSDAGGGSGIVLGGRTGATVKRCRVNGFSIGIALVSGSKNIIRNNRISDTSNAGIFIEGSNDNWITLNRLERNVTGILGRTSRENKVIANRIDDSGRDGILLAINSRSNKLLFNAISDSNQSGLDGTGIRLFRSVEGGPTSGDNDLKGNLVRRTAAGGFGAAGIGILIQSDSNTLTKNIVNHNAASGILVTDTPGFNTLRGNIANRNGGDGICAADPPNVDDGGNRARNNDGSQLDFARPCVP